MGKSNRPLSVLVDEDLYDHPLIQDLREKGNSVEQQSGEEYDLILTKKSWRVIPGMEDLTIPLAIKAARKEKYGKKATDDTWNDSDPTE